MSRLFENLRVTLSKGTQDLAAIRQLRYAILRKPLEMSFESALLAEDHLESTFHILAWSDVNQQELVGCATLHEPDRINRPDPRVQIRGMAVHERVQGMGVGRLIVQEAKRFAQAESKSLWCNARQTAVGFYEKQGFMRCGEWFDIPVIGLHVKMEWSIT
jgi:predicted GNAT family N-acyltransferase